MTKEFVGNLAAFSRAYERFKFSLADARKTVERNRHLIEETSKVLDRLKKRWV